MDDPPTLPTPAMPGAHRWHSYRCPVCGHTDEVDLDAGPPASVWCSHCHAELEVAVRSPEAAAAAVRVATRRRRAR
jgi:ribosomal protein L37AE/L43A